MPGDVVRSTATPPWAASYQVRAASPDHQPLDGRPIQTQPPPGIIKATPLAEFMTTEPRVLSTKAAAMTAVPAAAVAATKPAAKPTAQVAAANQTAAPTKKPKKTSKDRSRDHRDRWKELASREEAQPRPRPRPLAILRSLTPEAILQPQGGFQTKAKPNQGFQTKLPCSWHSAKTQPHVACRMQTSPLCAKEWRCHCYRGGSKCD